ncbi:MAG: type II CAAX endopeptidase family protein [Candidatus Thermoplasmatota archaeon]|nr:type II CAAX endopeptidase family protein [Candidatus Thermoplasmatota archaeon]
MSIFLKPEHQGSEEEMMKDPVWNGVPPVGKNPIGSRSRLLMLVLAVFMVKITIWTVYRWMTGNVYPLTDPRVEDWVSLFAKPLLQLGPVFILWWVLFKEKGSPFRLTKVNLFSSLIWGLIGGVLFYMVASLIYVGQMNFFGFGRDFHVVAGWMLRDVGWFGVISLLFTYMLSTGPAEELFSRGFIQDQTARGFSLSTSIIISAFLFAIGHLPISIMVHRLSATEIFWYMCALMLMGMFFSIIYQMSRNIVLVIIIHGLWNWFLTLFAVRGAYDASFLANAGANFGRADLINTFLTISIMLPFFYALYRIFWRKLRSGDRPGIEEALRDIPIVRMIRERDRGDWPKRPWIMTVTITTVFCLSMIPIAAVVGTYDPSLAYDRVTPESMDPMEVHNVSSVFSENFLQEGDMFLFDLERNITIYMVNVTLKWTDEPPAGPRYTNLADHFRVAILGSASGELDSASGSSGFIELHWSTDPEMALDDITVSVEMIEAGDQEPMVSLIGLRTVSDDGNSFRLDVSYHTVTYLPRTEESGDVRW